MRKTMRSGRRWWGLDFSHLQIAGFTLHTFFSSQCQFYLSIILTIFKVVRRLSRSLGYFHYLSIYTLRKISLPFPRIEEGYLRHCSLYVNSKSRKKYCLFFLKDMLLCHFNSLQIGQLFHFLAQNKAHISSVHWFER